MSKNKSIVVTGGSRGIGRAIAIEFANQDYDVLITYLSNEIAAQEVLEAIEAAGAKGVAIKADTCDKTSAGKIIECALNAFGKIDVLVNNAGISPPKEFLVDQTVEDWDATMDANLSSAFRMVKAVIPHMRKQASGNIINISSNVTRRLAPNFGPYAVSKAGLEALTQVLSKEEASHGIRVNAIAPGFIETDMLRNAFNELGEAKAREYEESIPMKRLGRPEEIANMVAVLASNTSSFVTGQVIYVNGGGPGG
jgi:3-oxoacyl-[acyl-carrier protein] reductase